MTPLHLAVRAGAADIVRLLVARGGIVVRTWHLLCFMRNWICVHVSSGVVVCPTLSVALQFIALDSTVVLFMSPFRNVLSDLLSCRRGCAQAGHAWS